VRFSTFFSNLKLKIRKRTFINVLFSKIENRFEKTLHIHFFSVRLRHFRDLTFMLSFLFGEHGHVQTIMLRIAEAQYRRTDGPTDGPTDGEAVFANSWMCIFGG
jgi:hypothetical protein